MAVSIKDFRMAIRIDNSEAKAKFDETKRQLADVAAQMKKLEEEGSKNSKAYKELKKQHDALNTSLYRQRLEAGRTALTYNELRQGASQLRRAMNNVKPGTAEWKQLREELRLTQQRMKELSGTATETGLSLGKLADGFNRYAAIGASALATLTGMTLTMRKCVDEYAQMEEAESQVIKYTGMTAEEVKQLNEEFKAMDTRTPREELNRLAGEAGKLGITGVQEVREFVEAANQINVALGEDLGEEAVNQIGKLSQMFGDESRSLKENMLAIGSAVNQVAQSTSASEPYLVQFTARMGGVGKQAKMSVTDIMGFASALDQNMLRSEMASTALSGLIMRIYQEPAKYAKLAGMDVEQFTQLVETDVNEAVMSFLSSLNKMGGMAQMAPVLKEMQLSGAEAASVISTLAGNVDLVRKEQENANVAFTEGTSITNEYAVQNNTVQARLEKLQNDFKNVRVELGERLLPVMRYMISTGSLTVKGLMAVTEFLMDYKSVILTVTTAIAAYTLVVKSHTLAVKAMELGTKAATVATRVFNTVTKASPWGLLVAGASAAISYLLLFRDETDKTTSSQKAFNEELERTNEAMNRIAKVKVSAENIQFLNPKQQQQLKADAQREIDELDNIISQGMIANKQWYEAERKSLLQQAGDNEILQKSYLRGLEHDLQERMEVIAGYIEEKEKLQQIVNAIPDTPTNTTTGTTVPGGGTDDTIKALEDRFKLELQAQQNAAKEKKLQQIQEGEDSAEIERAYNDALFKAEMEFLQKKKAALQAYGQDTTEIQGQIYDKMIDEANRLYEAGQAQDTANRQAAFDAVDADAEAQRRAAKQAFINGELQDEQAYRNRLLEIERDYLQARKALLASFGEDTSEVDDQLLNLDVSQKQGSDRQAARDKRTQREEGLSQIRKSTDADEQNAIAQRLYEEDLINFEEYQELKTKITEEQEQRRQEIAQAAMNTIGQAAGAASQLIGALQDAELSRVQRKYDKEIAAARKAGKDTTKLEEEKEAAMNAVKKKYADKQFAANVLQVTASTAVAAMNAYSAMASIPIVGPALGAIAAAAAIAAGAAQIAVAKQQRDEAKGLKSGGYSRDYIEGYTTRGNPDETAGVIPVHKNEFVANHEAVANPAVKQFLDVFDMAQKRGTIRMLNTTQILEQIRTRGGRYSGGYTAENVGASRSSASPLPGFTAEQRSQVVLLLEENNRLLTVLTQKELVVDPRKVRDSINHINQLEKNVSR